MATGALLPHQIHDRKFLRLQGNNSLYLRLETVENCNKILDVLVEYYLRTGKNKPHHLGWIHHKTGINGSSISYALFVMAFMKEPKINIYGAAYTNRILFKHPRIMLKTRLHPKFMQQLKEEKKDGR